MKIYFLRHGIAEDGGPDMSDRDRELTETGVADMEKVAKGLRRMGIHPDIILSSPFPRAFQTADIVANAMGLIDKLQKESVIAPGFRMSDLQHLAAEHPGVNSIMVVGHNPEMSMLPSQLIGGGYFSLQKGAIACVECEMVDAGSGRLLWLLTPGLLKK